MLVISVSGWSLGRRIGDGSTHLDTVEPELFDLDMEMSVLGSMILSESAKLSVADYLVGADFFRPAHRLLFDALVKMPGEPDLVRLKTALGKNLSQAGGEAYLMQVAEFVPSAASSARYSEVVKDRSRRRQLYAESQRLSSLSQDFEKELADDLPRSASLLAELCKNGKVQDDWVWMDSVVKQKPPWVYRPILAKGLVTLLEGNPGDGKSTLAAALAGAITTGSLVQGLPDQPRNPPGAAIMLCAEDSLTYSLAARLASVGADQSKVIARESPFTFNYQGLTEISKMIAQAKSRSEGGAVLFVADPIMSYLGGRGNTNADNEVREMLKDLFSLMLETEVAPLILTHMNKSSERALQRVMGSVAFAAMPRVVIMAGRDPDDDEKGVLAWVKSNIGPRFKSLGFKIDSDADDWVRFSWVVGGSEVSADSMTAPRAIPSRKGSPKTDKCKVWLMSALAGCALRSDAVLEQGKEAGFLWRMIYDIRDDIGVDVVRQPKEAKTPGAPHSWWALPGYNWAKLEAEWAARAEPVQAELPPEPPPDEDYDPFSDPD